MDSSSSKVPPVATADGRREGSSDGYDSDEPPELTSAPSKVPLTILTGYLGSGKSTLLDHILTTQHGRKIAVIMNEFGDSADIEAKSISIATEETRVEEWLEMDNGCLCCSVRDTGMLAIQSLMEKKGRFDQILLETTGLADPGPIVTAFWDEPALCMDVVLDAVITVVDAAGIEKQLSEVKVKSYNEAQRQIAVADVVLLNKTDLVTPEKLDDIESMLRSINSTVVIHRTTRSQVDLAQILDLNIYAESSRPVVPASLEGLRVEEHDHHDHDHSNCSGDCSEAKSTERRHSGDIESVSIPLPVLDDDLKVFEKLLRDVLWSGIGGSDGAAEADMEVDVLRTKGFLKTKDGRSWVVQGVRDLYELKEVPGEVVGGDDKVIEPKLVLIGKSVKGLASRFQGL